MLDSCILESICLCEGKTSDVAVIIKLMIKVLNFVIRFCKLLKAMLLAPAQILNGLSGTGWNACSLQKWSYCADVVISVLVSYSILTYIGRCNFVDWRRVLWEYNFLKQSVTKQILIPAIKRHYLAVCRIWRPVLFLSNGLQGKLSVHNWSSPGKSDINCIPTFFNRKDS